MKRQMILCKAAQGPIDQTKPTDQCVDDFSEKVSTVDQKKVICRRSVHFGS